jgi:replicative DNA helicase
MNRSLRPAGSSLLLRWPEFGLGLKPASNRKLGGRIQDLEMIHWRGDRDDRNWPHYLTMGDPHDWPWQWSLGAPAEES